MNELSCLTPLLSVRVRGKWHESVIFQVRHGKQYVRSLSAYDKSAKTTLVPYQPKFAAAVAAWQGFSLSEKNYWNQLAKNNYRRLPGYQFFLSAYLHDKADSVIFLSGSLSSSFNFDIAVSYSF